MAEDYSSPGDLIVGTDSHTCTSGGLGAFATGMGRDRYRGRDEVKENMAARTGVVESCRPWNFTERSLRKDLILKTLSLLGTDGATYKSIEFEGLCN